jgi:hypothetical protein
MLFSLPIWVDKPDVERFGEYASLFEAAFTNNTGDGPANGLAHTAVRYNYSYWAHVTGGYYSTGHQQSIDDILGNIDALYSTWVDGTGHFDGPAFTADAEDFLSQPRFGRDFSGATTDPQSFETEEGVFRDVLGLSLPPQDLIVNDVPGKRSEYSLYLRALAQNFALFGGLFGFVKDVRTIEAGGEDVGIDLSKPKELIKSIVDMFNGLTITEAVRWTMNQLSSKDMANANVKNGIQSFPNDHLWYEVKGAHGTITKFLGGPNFQRYFRSIL